MYSKEDVKLIANAFRIKCSKYENLTPELCDKLFDEALNECYTMKKINSVTTNALNVALTIQQRSECLNGR